VAVQPEMAPAVRRMADRFSVQAHKVRDRCVRVEVTSLTAAEAVRSLAKGRLTADAWVPESSRWFDRATAAGVRNVPGGAVGLASSPVVLATTRPVAAELGAALDDPSWKLLRSGQAGRTDLTRRMLDPAVSMTGTVAMVALGQVAAADPGFVADMRRVAPAGPGPLFAALTGASRSERALLVSTEQAVAAYNDAHQPNPAIALLPREGTLLLDYPYVITARDATRREAAAAFQAELGSKLGRRTLASFGFRAPDGTMAGSGRTDLGAAAPKALRLPTRQELDRAERSWGTLT
jgi:hypothetical protein